MWGFYVYLHRRADTGEPFYVGKGRVHRREPYRRANATGGRNAWWRRIVARHGLTVEIAAHFMTDADAQSFEKALIAAIGRADLHLGPLVNLTDGGDGHCGLIIPPELRKLRSENAKRPRPSSWVLSMRASRKNGGNGGVVKSGDRLPEWWRARIAAAKVGQRNPMHGRTGAAHPRSRSVIDSVSGETYPSVVAAAFAAGVKMQTLHNMLAGTRHNRTTLRFL